MKTRENYFYKLVNYMKSVYNTEHGLNKLEDGRVNPTYTTAQAVTPVLLGFLLIVHFKKCIWIKTAVKLPYNII